MSARRAMQMDFGKGVNVRLGLYQHIKRGVAQRGKGGVIKLIIAGQNIAQPQRPGKTAHMPLARGGQCDRIGGGKQGPGLGPSRQTSKRSFIDDQPFSNLSGDVLRACLPR